MRYLGIDYGDSKVGFAVGNDKLAAPDSVFHYNNQEELFTKIGRFIAEDNVKEIVIGVSEGKSAEKSSDFASKVEDKFGLPVHLADETLSTSDAISHSIEAGIGRKKRKNMEDAYAAAIILQNFIDNT